MLIDFPILTLIVFLPSLGALLAYATGSDRAARGVSLAISLIVLGLATILLVGFLRPDWFSLASVAIGGHVYYAAERYDWVRTVVVHYFLEDDELFVVIVFMN